MGVYCKIFLNIAECLKFGDLKESTTYTCSNWWLKIILQYCEYTFPSTWTKEEQIKQRLDEATERSYQ